MFKKFMKSIMMPKHIALSSVIIVACTALLGIILLVEVPMLTTLNEVTDATGSSLGKAAGMVSGSVKALFNINLNPDKDDDGSNERITEAAIKKDFGTICVLELLSTDVKVHYEWTYGDEDSPTYANMYILEGKGIFYTDLSQADVAISNGVVEVILKEPSLEIYFKGTPESIAEYVGLSNPFEKIEKANAGYLEERSKAILKVKEKMYGYEGLLSRSKDSAEKTVKEIVKSVYGLDARIGFKGKGEVYEGK